MYIHADNLLDQDKRAYRIAHAQPLVTQFFAWTQVQFDHQGLLPNSPLTKALSYECERRIGLEVFLDDPDMPVDTNRLKRLLRVIPMGR